jgi:nicotinate-nucleotide--dimethylbenzimidazole phosphoribosyltransferase
VSAYPSEVTAAMVRNFVMGGAAASVLARSSEISLSIVDVGVAHPYDVATKPGATPPNGTGEPAGTRLVRDPVADLPAGDLRIEPAMPVATLVAALEAGRRAIDGLADLRVVAIGEMGIGNTTPAACLVAGLLDLPGERIVGRGTGVDDEGLARKRVVVADALARVGSREALTLLGEVGGREIAAMVGAMARAAERRIAILVDGFIATAAALVLVRANPSARHAMIFAHHSREVGHAYALDALNARPLLDLGMALGEASGALAAFPLVELACATHESMATFAEAAVPDGKR